MATTPAAPAPKKGALAWFNAVPGRKRTIAAVFGGLSVTLRALGLGDWADAADGVTNVTALIVPGVDVTSVVFLIIGMVAKWKREREGVKDSFVDKVSLEPIVPAEQGYVEEVAVLPPKAAARVEVARKDTRVGVKR